jgi:hypothetical protein
MYIVPELVDFENDVYQIRVTDDYTIILNIVDEYFSHEGRTIVIDGLNIAAQYVEGGIARQIACPNIIGLSNELVSIIAEDPSLLGIGVKKSNLGSWGLVINE